MIDTNKATISLIPAFPEEWASSVDFPHMTLVYAGESLDAASFNELSKDAAMLAAFVNPIRLVVSGLDRFGSDQEVEVLRLRPTWELWSMRRAVEKWNKSEFEFKPHVTVGPVGTQLEYVPRAVRFNAIAATWGNTILPFRLSHNND